MNAIAQRLRRSLDLFKSSVLVIRDHPKLLVFPALTTLLTLGIVLFFLFPVIALALGSGLHGGEAWKELAVSLGLMRVGEAPHTHHVQLSPLGMSICAVLYLASMFLATFFNVAFNSQILAALNGQGVSIRRAFEVAMGRAQSILFWSLLAGFVGLLIRTLEERLSFVGRLVTGLIGLAWSISSVFAIPILVRESSTSNPLRVLSRSAQTIKRTWGEMLVGYVGLQGANVVFLWCSLVFWVLVGVGAYLASNAWILLPALGCWLVALMVYAYLAGVASKVYLCALYLYATEGVVPTHYDAAMMDQAWKVKAS